MCSKFAGYIRFVGGIEGPVQAACHDCDWVGPDRDTLTEANDDCCYHEKVTELAPNE